MSASVTPVFNVCFSEFAKYVTVVKMHVFTQFIPSLALALHEHGHYVTLYPGDGNLTIVETALKWTHAQ